MSKTNPQVFLDVSIDGDPIERMVFELFSDIVPKTAENFRALCTGEKGISRKSGRPLHYKGTFFHRIIKGSMAEGGDFLRRDGNYGESIYGGKFPDESPKLKHDEPGLLSMSIADRDTRGSLFVVTFKANHRLDRKYVVFGKLVQGHEILKKIENAGDEEGRPAVTVKIINCGEFHVGENQSDAVLGSDKRKASKLKSVKGRYSEANSHESRRIGKHKKSSKERRKKRKRYYMSESDSSFDSETESSESDSDSDSDISTSSDISSSSDDRRRKRKRSSKRGRYRHGKRRDRRREKKRKRRDKRAKHRSRRGTSDSISESASRSGSSSEEDNGNAPVSDEKHKNLAPITVGTQSPLVEEKEADSVRHKRGEPTDVLEREEGEYPRENGDRHSNGTEVENRSDKGADRQPDIVDDLPSKSRSRSISPKRMVSKSMSISPKRSSSKSISPRRVMSRSPCVNGSPPRVLQRSRSPVGSGSSKSPGRSASTSPVKGRKRKSVSPSPVRTQSRRSISRSPVSPLRSISQSPQRTSSKKSPRRSVSRSPQRAARRSDSRTPVRSSRRSSRSSGRVTSRRSPSRSPVRVPTRNNRSSYSRSPPAGGGRRARSPISDRGRSLSRSPSPDGSPKRIRRGRGFSERYSYVRRYRSPPLERSPVRYRYGNRSDRDRYSSYRRSPRHYRSPPRRSPPRYRGRRSRTRSPSVSRSPIRYRTRRYSPIRSRSPVEPSRYRPSPRMERRRSPSRSRSPASQSRSPSESRSSRDSQSPIRSSRGKSMSRSPSESPPGKKGLVNYEDVSPDSGPR